MLKAILYPKFLHFYVALVHLVQLVGEDFGLLGKRFGPHDSVNGDGGKFFEIVADKFALLTTTNEYKRCALIGPVSGLAEFRICRGYPLKRVRIRLENFGHQIGFRFGES
jgi:hypothetical protein